MPIELKWSEGKPKVADLYFVAVELGPIVGVYELVTWDGEKWNYERPEEIVAFIKFNDFKRQLDIKWPKPEPIIPAYGKLPDEDWVEVGFDESGKPK